MRKNLHYKVLASVLAIAGLYFYNAPAACADYHGDGTAISIDDNKIVINGQTTELQPHDDIYGNYPNSGDANGDGNTTNVTIQSSELFRVFGGHSEYGNANNNKVLIEGSNNKFYQVIGGSAVSGEATGNTVTINGSVTLTGISNASYIAGGRGGSGSIVSDNHVIIQSGTVSGNIYGGYVFNNNDETDKTSEISGNNITIINTEDKETDISEANLYGGYAAGNNIEIKENTLTLVGWSGSVNSVQNFSAIDFEKVKWQNGGTVLNIKNASQDVLKGTEININSLNFEGGTEINKGDNMTFVASANDTDLGITEDNLNVNSGFFAGVTVKGDGNFTVDANGNVIYTVQEIKTNKQIDLVAENRAVAAAFINQGTDLISDSLDVISRDGNYGVKTFAAVQGNRSKYDVNSDLKINGWSTIVGVGSETEHNGGDFSWGVFYENGSGNYRTFNEFNNEFFRGDGSLVYNGGGIAARYENAHGVYTEGSLRAGMLKSEMDNALSDGENKYGYSSESEYYGAHIGIGQIIPLSESSDLDVYGKFFHTYTEGDSFNVAGDKFEFDSINSDRLRVGARVTTNKANAFSTYYGLAYEYEFNGDAEMRAQNLAAPTQSLQGSSYMAELGFNYQPTPDSPWNFDLNMRGYAGEREGATFNVQATYTF